MTSMSQNRDLDSTFARHVVTLRTVLGLTQTALAERLGVTERAIQRWEAGTRYPKIEYFKAFLALCIEQHALPAGQEVEQVRMLWKAAHLKVLFDEHWVLGLLHEQAPLSPVQERVGTRMPQSLMRPVDWGEEVSEVSFYGRESEQTQLTTWIQEDRCRLIALLGMGGIGKSALAVTLLHQLSSLFSVAIFRSVRDAIPCEELVADLIQALAPEPLSELPVSLTPRITLLIEMLQKRRCLLVLDNVETLLQEGERSGRYRVGYEGYGQLFERIGSTQHQSCVVLTSREKPSELKPLEGSRMPVRSLHLIGIDEEAGEQILMEKQLRGEAEARRRLIDAYSGNPLALKIVAETIRELFAGEIASFLAEGQIIFQGVRALLAQQFVRLPFLAQSVLFWLAIVREPVDVSSLLERFVTPVPRLSLLEALEDLRRRSLVEHGQQRSQFTLQSVVMEFVTDTLVKQMASEVQRREPDYLLTYALSLASAKEYIRQTQERLLLAPVLFHLGASQQRKGVVEQQLLHCLDLLRSRELNEQGYGPTNVMMLLNQLIGNLHGVDLSNCALREAYLQGSLMQDASLRRSFVQESTFTEVFDTVRQIAVRHDGTYWAATSNTGDVRIFQGESSTPLLVLQAHNSAAVIAFSSDRQTLATGGRDNLVKIWDLEYMPPHATLRATLQGHRDFITCIAFAPDGIRFATSSLDGTVRIWDSASFQLLHLLQSHKEGVSRVIWSPDGRLLASAGDDNIRLWDAQHGEEIRTLADDGNAIYGLAFSPDSQFLVSGGTDRLVKIWKVSEDVCIQTLAGHQAKINNIVWSPDGRLLASGSYDNTVRIWQADPAIAHQVLLGHTANVQTVAFTTDGTRVLSGGEDGTVRLWEVASGYCVRIMQGYSLTCHAVAWSPHEDIIASAMSDGRIILWNSTDEKILQVLQGHTNIVHSLTWSPDGQMLSSASSDRTIRLWQIHTGECLAVLRGHTDPVSSVDWSPDGRLLASGGYYDKTVRIWDIEKLQCRWVSDVLTAGIQMVAWSPDGIYLASGDDDGTVKLWNAEDGTLLKLFHMPQGIMYGVVWSPDSKWLACCCGTRVFRWDIASGEHLQTLPGTSRMIALDWSPRGNRLVSGDRSGNMYWWENERWTCLSMRKEHRDGIHSISISPDGNTVVSADNNAVIIIWDLEQAVPLRTLRPDRPYERLDISGIQGMTEAQKATLRALGAVGN
jgi:WD40 repeat protein/DNA-binding XRE family transcriptional regulator